MGPLLNCSVGGSSIEDHGSLSLTFAGTPSMNWVKEKMKFAPTECRKMKPYRSGGQITCFFAAGPASSADRSHRSCPGVACQPFTVEMEGRHEW